VNWDNQSREFAGRRPLRLVVRCSCGARGAVQPGALWLCPDCRRAWDTSAVPAEEYRSLVRAVRRAKWLATSGLLVVAVIFAPLIGLVSRSFLVPALIVLAVWYFWFLPSHRKRLRRIYASLPQWQITETPSAADPGGSHAEPDEEPASARVPGRQRRERPG
jgi:hypothetical protein